jgi:hypothetical protein
MSCLVYTQVMLAEFIKNKSVRLNGVVGIYPAASAGDDIVVYADEKREEVKAKMYGLRQQVRGGGGSRLVCCCRRATVRTQSTSGSRWPGVIGPLLEVYGTTVGTCSTNASSYCMCWICGEVVTQPLVLVSRQIKDQRPTVFEYGVRSMWCLICPSL